MEYSCQYHLVEDKKNKENSVHRIKIGKMIDFLSFFSF